jgi:hypothetical protein
VTKKIEALDGLLVFQMRQRSLLTRVELDHWRAKLQPHVDAVAEWLGNKDNADAVLFNLAILMSYTDAIVVKSEDNAVLLEFAAWWAKRDDPSYGWVMAHCATSDAILDIWSKAYQDGVGIFDIDPVRKAPDAMTAQEKADAVNPPQASSSNDGNGRIANSKRPEKESRETATAS